MHKSEPVLENETSKIIYNFDFTNRSLNLCQKARPSFNSQEKEFVISQILLFYWIKEWKLTDW